MQKYFWESLLFLLFFGVWEAITGEVAKICYSCNRQRKILNTRIFNFIQKFASPNQKIEADQIEKFLSSFIGEKLIEKEVEHFGIKLSDNSLSKLIKIKKDFKRENKFSRIEYEKFLLKNNITAADF